jgi:hypothetical protein
MIILPSAIDQAGPGIDLSEQPEGEMKSEGRRKKSEVGSRK